MARSSDTSLPQLPPRDPQAHKGDFGRALLIGGSRGMSGAISLAGMAALRGGAGLVRLAVPDACLETVALFDPCYMTVPLACDADGRIALAAREEIAGLAEDATCLALGPGLGRSQELTVLVGWMYETLTQPMVVDADALNALASHPTVLAKPAGPRVITPHPGEFRRLLGSEKLSLDPDPAHAIELATEHDIVVVLKGHQTLVTDGRRKYRNTTGNPGMATGGTGDVLTGLVTALLCQGLDPFEAAQLGVYMHGLAGDMAAEDLGQVSLVASDLIDYFSDAFLAVSDEP